MLSSNRYQLLEPVSGSTELVFENIQKTDTLRLPGNTINRNRKEMHLLFKILKEKDLQ